jgi:hypothetical protein
MIQIRINFVDELTFKINEVDSDLLIRISLRSTLLILSSESAKLILTELKPNSNQVSGLSEAET